MHNNITPAQDMDVASRRPLKEGNRFLATTKNNMTSALKPDQISSPRGVSHLSNFVSLNLTNIGTLFGKAEGVEW